MTTVETIAKQFVDDLIEGRGKHLVHNHKLWCHQDFGCAKGRTGWFGCLVGEDGKKTEKKSNAIDIETDELSGDASSFCEIAKKYYEEVKGG